jgi:L-ascorbate metabolism protein UlaG (beta-lactamase superfamily)
MRLAKGLLLLLVLIGCAHVSISQYNLGREHTRKAVDLPSVTDVLDASYRYVFEPQLNQVPLESIEVYKLSRAELDALPNDRISAVRFGHSTVLLKIEGQYWLTDPVFSNSLGPIYSLGIERFHDAPLNISELPHIKGVLISHNHYDHLDRLTIEALRKKVEHFYVPLGNGEYLVDWGIDPENITELDWWESIEFGELTVIATPANHISGRVLIDQNKALWSSWVLHSNTQSVFFSGDSGYSGIFKEIGERYGPFDLTLMENGSYDHSWEGEHLMPEQAVQAHIDLSGNVLMSIHNSTFDLAFHEWNAPLESISQLAKRKGINLALPPMGKPVTVESRSHDYAWLKQDLWWQSK